ncbi:hypothetical protein A3D72_00265 [Candidatus Uhrbacteria bacterium RIFCSPHIGHO2_02_FULL_57_19]|uniref:Uncharacterized protein n=1 Tax=Candidatus Uhrbacteria bacterium RIFCSPHIGHO2_02_FULL_57_19 TaxID=1802391 RepID=A0A1F7U4I3_9BACT|nr:MAG: hypothetical protein A3D72_00265 [Candidatus Uhrbacteria bacterium RIFCSPHIGHO2_02_FULL_57_19]
MSQRKTFPPVAPYIERLLDEHVDDPEEFVRIVRMSDLSVPAMLDLAIESDRDPMAVARELGGAR